MSLSPHHLFSLALVDNCDLGLFAQIPLGTNFQLLIHFQQNDGVTESLSIYMESRGLQMILAVNCES